MIHQQFIQSLIGFRLVTSLTYHSSLSHSHLEIQSSFSIPLPVYSRSSHYPISDLRWSRRRHHENDAKLSNWTAQPTGFQTTQRYMQLGWKSLRIQHRLRHRRYSKKSLSPIAPASKGPYDRRAPSPNAVATWIPPRTPTCRHQPRHNPAKHAPKCWSPTQLFEAAILHVASAIL